MGGMFVVGPGWAHESLLAFCVAATWMGVATGLVKFDVLFTSVMFSIGAFCAWYVTRGAMASVSPWTGLMPIASACAGGSVVWMLRARRQGRSVCAALLIPSAILIVFVFQALASAAPGSPAVMRLEDGRSEEVRSVVLRSVRGDTTYIWRPHVLPSHSDAMKRVTMPDDSGDWHEIVLVSMSAAERATACRAFIDATIQMRRVELERSEVPYFMTYLPTRTLACETGSMWRAHQP